MLSPDLMGQLGGGSAEGMPPQQPPAGPGPASNPSDILRQILDLADEYRQQEDSDQNLLLVEQLRTIAQKILANEEADADSLLQGKASPRALRTHG